MNMHQSAISDFPYSGFARSFCEWPEVSSQYLVQSRVAQDHGVISKPSNVGIAHCNIVCHVGRPDSLWHLSSQLKVVFVESQSLNYMSTRFGFEASHIVSTQFLVNFKVSRCNRIEKFLVYSKNVFI